MLVDLSVAADFSLPNPAGGGIPTSRRCAIRQALLQADKMAFRSLSLQKSPIAPLQNLIE